MERAIREEKLKQEVIDVTLPSKKNMCRTQTSEHDCTGRSRENFRWYGI